MIEWHDFFVAQLTASAALAGLLFVGVSLNLTRILALPGVPNRALAALVLLLTVLVISSLVLVPGQSALALGLEILIGGIVASIGIAILDRRTWQRTAPPYRRNIFVSSALNQLSLLGYIIGGILIMMGNLGGFYWLVPAILISLVKALFDSWVLLVEINR